MNFWLYPTASPLVNGVLVGALILATCAFAFGGWTGRSILPLEGQPPPRPQLSRMLWYSLPMLVAWSCLGVSQWTIYIERRQLAKMSGLIAAQNATMMQQDQAVERASAMLQQSTGLLRSCGHE